MRLILIRHGETDDNLQKKYSGARNPSLNSKGKWQAQRLSDCLKDTKVDKVYSSDLKRACETARIVFPCHDIEKTKDLREMRLGIFEGMQYKEIMEKYPEVYKGWIENPWKTSIPKGEGLKEMTQRVGDRLSSILSRDGDKTVAIVTHGGTARIILHMHNKVGAQRAVPVQERFWEIEQNNAALNIIDFQQGTSSVVKMNDTSHLN